MTDKIAEKIVECFGVDSNIATIGVNSIQEQFQRLQRSSRMQLDDFVRALFEKEKRHQFCTKDRSEAEHTIHLINLRLHSAGWTVNGAHIPENWIG